MVTVSGRIFSLLTIGGGGGGGGGGEPTGSRPRVAHGPTCNE